MSQPTFVTIVAFLCLVAACAPETTDAPTSTAASQQALCTMPSVGQVFYHYSETSYPGLEEGQLVWQQAEVVVQSVSDDGLITASGSWIDLSQGPDGPLAEYEIELQCQTDGEAPSFRVVFTDTAGIEPQTIEQYGAELFDPERSIAQGIVDTDTVWGEDGDLGGARAFFATEHQASAQSPVVLLDEDSALALNRLWDEAALPIAGD